MDPVASWRLITPGGIPYKKLEGTLGEFSKHETAVSSEEYIIQSSDLLAFAQELFPEPIYLFGTLIYPTSIRLAGTPLIPLQMKYKSNDPGLPIDPFGADPSAPSGTYCNYLRVTIDYGVNPANDQDQDPNDPFTFLEVSASASGVFLNSPVQGQAVWEVPSGSSFSVSVVDGQEVWSGESSEMLETSVPNTIVEPQIEWNVRWPQIPYSFWNSVLIARLRDKLGKVNSTPVILLQNAPADTILFMGFTLSTSFTWRSGRVGQNPVTLDMKFVEKNFTWGTGSSEVDVTHQHVWRPNFGWRKLKIDGQYLYKQANLNSIWGTA